jgi:hypothetical protein
VQIRAADPGFVDTDEHIIDPALRLRDILEPEAGSDFALTRAFMCPAIARPV